MARRKKIEQPATMLEQLKAFVAKIEKGEIKEPVSLLLFRTHFDDVGMSQFTYDFFNSDDRDRVFLATIGKRMVEKDLVG